ncbi:hypothetical protein [Haloferula sp. BvORR071]|uniref:hypothetical protein n=1 Tax=Haloferula sp. BvORR071 TaxID=1396141 RepID=UPI00054D8BD2|nr:hypothetical protein [Haloferula sp. BvORR071]
MKLLLLALGVSVLFAGWQWFRPYEWSPDPAARYRVTECMVERDHANLWLRVFLKPRDGQEMDYLKPIRLTTGSGRQLEPAQMDQMGRDNADSDAPGQTDPNKAGPGPVDAVVLSFWLETSDFGGPFKLELNGGTLQIRSNNTLPQVADGGVRVFNSTNW